MKKWTILLLALGTGMRRQELCALAWTDVDFEAGTLTIRRAGFFGGESPLRIPR